MHGGFDGVAVALADRYRLERELGHGGMATVYLAHDLRHERQVAIKVLHPELAAALGVDRFLAEIKVTANLQHPNILPLLDSGLLGTAGMGGIPYYVMPYIEGESLRHRLVRERQLPVGDALLIAKGAAAALGYAHKHGVIHRDIKPENILLQDGQPVVADFGIALAVTAAGGQRLTQTGLSLGTPHYMSPEQAMGERTIDARTDVYALGVVTYEMLAGEPPFTGPTSPAVVAKVLTEKPRPLVSLRDTVPPHVDAAVQQALQKLPADRFASAAEFATALSAPASTAPGYARALPSGAPGGRRARLRFRTVAPWLLTAAAIVLAAWALQRPAPNVEREQWDLVVPDSAPILMSVREAFAVPAISMDGTMLAYTAQRDSSTMLYLARLGAGDTRALPQTRGGYAPFFAPDGRKIGFLSENQIRAVDVETGSVTVIREGIDAVMGTWTSSGRIAFEDAGGFAWIADDGTGEIHRIPPQPFIDVRRPWAGIVAIPSTDRVLVADAELRVGVVTLSDGSLRYLTAGSPSALPPRLDEAMIGSWPKFVSPDHIVMWRPGAIQLAVRFDPQSLRAFGKPIELARGVRATVIGLSPSGTWAYPPTLGAGGSAITELHLDGSTNAYPLPNRRYQSVALSRDERHLAIGVFSESGRQVVEVYDLSSKPELAQRIDAAGALTGYFDRAARHLYVGSQTGTVYRRDLGSGEQDSAVVPRAAHEFFELDGVAGDDTLLVTIGVLGQRDIVYVPFAEPNKRAPLLQRDGDQYQAALAPSGRWFAYASVERGARTLIVEPRPPTGQRIRIGAGTSHVWDDRDQLYFIAAGRVYRVTVSMTASGPVAGAPVQIARAGQFGMENGQPFAPMRGGQSLLALIATAPETAKHFVVVRHYERDLARLVK